MSWTVTLWGWCSYANLFTYTNTDTCMWVSSSTTSTCYSTKNWHYFIFKSDLIILQIFPKKALDTFKLMLNFKISNLGKNQYFEKKHFMNFDFKSILTYLSFMCSQSAPNWDDNILLVYNDPFLKTIIFSNLNMKSNNDFFWEFLYWKLCVTGVQIRYVINIKTLY